MPLRFAALSSLFILMAACSDSTTGGSGRGGSGGTDHSGGNAGSAGAATGGGGSTGGNGGATGGSGGATGGAGGATGGSGGATGGSGGATGGSGGATGGSGGATGGTGGATGGSGGATGGSGGATGGTGGATGGSGGTGGTGGVPDAGGKGGNAGTGGSAGKDAGAGGGTVDAAPPPPVDGGPPDIPTPHGTCPDFVTGDVMFTPASGGTRKVAITMGDASKTGGPLIVYWYATGSNPTEATSRGLPASTVSAAGGVIAAPYDPNTGDSFPWLSHVADHEALFDEILACAAQKTKISVGRVHTVGFSAGALMTTQLSFARSKYLASVATYSGGQQGSATFQEMNNKFAAMIMTGGTNDTFPTTPVTDFFALSQTWQTTLKGATHFAMLCNHGGGHAIPSKTIVGGVFQFFMDHPYGTNPSPYAGGKIPTAISICQE